MKNKPMMNEMMSNFQNPKSFSMWNILNLNNSLMAIMIMLLLSMMTIMLFLSLKNLTLPIEENNKMEMMWTSTPSIILLAISLPSLMILYSTEEMPKSMMNIKIMASQWFWTYEYPQMKINMMMDSIMTDSDSLRCLMTSNPMVMVTKIPTTLLISSNDVIHSFSINQVGSKMDAVPGRINQMSVETTNSGMMTGQCSEICGMNHSFMPILISSINMMTF